MSLYLGDIPIANDGLQRLTGEIGDIGIAPFGIDESLNLRRYLNGQIISQTQFEAFTNKVKSAIALYPNLSATEENWQAEVTASVLGQCGKFVIDDEAGTIRLPKVVNINGLQDLTLIGGIKAESLPDAIYYSNAAWGGTDAPNSLVASKGGYEDNNTGKGLLVATRLDTSSSYDYSYGKLSASNPTYQEGANVQQEAVQYPYYIQVATGIEETLPAIREYGINTPFFFGQSMWTDVDPNNASWLLSNAQWNSKSVYPDYYVWLLGLYNNPTESNVIKVGSVVDDNGVLSGFSAANNVLLPVTFSPENNPWEIVIKFKTPQTFTEQGLISKTHQNGINYGLRIALASNGMVYYLIGSSYNTFVCESIGVQTLNINTNYYIKFEFTGEAYKAYISTDAETWTEDFSFSTTTPIEAFDEPTYLGDNRYKNIPFAGSIDLNESYININGQRWWNGRKAIVVKTGETSIFPDYDFIINTADETFRLPLLNGEEDLISDKYENLTITATTQRFTAPANGIYTVSGIGFNWVDLANETSGASGSCSQPRTADNFGRYTVKAKRGDQIAVFCGAIPGSYQCRFVYATGNGTLYYYVGDVVQDASLINAGAVLSDVVDLKQNKLDREGNHTVVETYENGTEWYRVWSDGWCEQGGYVNSPVYHSTYTITLLIPYKDANYTPSLTRIGWYDAGIWGSHTNFVNDLTSSTFKIATSSEGGGLGVLKWEAKGYIR